MFENGSDIVVSKIDGADGALEASTFVGGSENDGLNLVKNSTTTTATCAAVKW